MMNQNSKTIRLTVLTSLIILGFGGVLYFAISQIYPQRDQSEPNLVWEQLFLDKDVFPQGWSKSQVFEDCVSAPLGSGCDDYQAKNMQFYYDDQNRAFELIRFYNDEEAAAKDFRDPNQLWFYVYSNMTDFEFPAELSTVNLNADQYKVQCNQDNETARTQCRMVGQYGRFLVEFTLSSPNLDYDVMKKALDAIDKQMELYRNKPPYNNGKVSLQNAT